MNTTTFAFAAVLIVATTHAQTLDLKSGEVVIGRVSAIDGEVVKIDVGYPNVEQRSIQRSEITPLSLYYVLAAGVDPSNAAAHMTLAETCSDLGLWAHVIAEAREAARLDRSMKSAAERHVGVARSEIAQGLLAEAREALDEGREAAARLALTAVVTDYSETLAGVDAKKLLGVLNEKEKAAQPKRLISKAQAAEALDRAEAHLKAAATVAAPTANHGGSKAQRRLESIVAHLEKGWGTIKDVDLAEPIDVELAHQLANRRTEMRRRLVESYLELGTAFIQRRAIPDAEKYCELACGLDPENRANHALHRLILNAKISRGGTVRSHSNR